MTIGKLLTSVKQLKVGTKIKIVSKSGTNDYGSVSVKKVIKMRHYDHDRKKWKPVHDYEILINRSKNYYFSMNMYFKGESWVKDVFVLPGKDKRLKRHL